MIKLQQDEYEHLLIEIHSIHETVMQGIRYTIDLIRGYHNLLEKEEAGSRHTYLWDGNVAGMREEKNGQNGWSNLSNHPNTSYYLQDELGSPIRLLDEEGNMRETYGYDEFGQDLYRNQGQIQPFGYTGYQSDRIAETYYAQAREYRAELGRFAGGISSRDLQRHRIHKMSMGIVGEIRWCWWI